MFKRVEIILWILFFLKVCANDSKHNKKEPPIVKNLTVSSFLDNNKYIRLNISWEKVISSSDFASIIFINSDSNEQCNRIQDVYQHPLHDMWIIVPSIEITHPAEEILNGCGYDIIFENDYRFNQSIHYNVPECVENKCQCGDIMDSPNKILDIKKISDDNIYLLSWIKSYKNVNTTIHLVYYRKKDKQSNAKMFVTEKKLKYTEAGVEIPLHDAQDGVPYTVTVEFIDEFGCVYKSLVDLLVPIISSGIKAYFVIFGLTLTVILVSATFAFMYIKNIKKKIIILLQKRTNPTEEDELGHMETKRIEETNVLYTPAEFIFNSEKFDKYEFPRNKLVINEEIGEGAFGKVYSAKAYELQGDPGCTEVAVKQLRMGFTSEEQENFQSEIETLKRIDMHGGHENVIKLLGCITMDTPYIMVMELAPCGSLKDYLVKLQEKWSKLKKRKCIFFPDDTSESSYILPDNIDLSSSTSFAALPKTPSPSTLDGEFRQNFRRGRFNDKTSPNRLPDSPSSPISLTSSRLPSFTDTEVTVLDEEETTFIASYTQTGPALCNTELQQFAFQIASGMQYLESIPITHRDLAARNILITSNKTLKISDFGLSRMGVYVNRKTKKLPLRWMAIEAIEDRTCSSKSDVWSFGIVLWEIGSLGAFPYEHTPDERILLDLKLGKRLERPKLCTDELYTLMLKCWEKEPQDRPSFVEIKKMLNDQKRKVYVDFN